MLREHTPDRALELGILRQAVAILEACGVEVPTKEGVPTLSHQIVGGTSVTDGLHLFRLPAAGDHKSRRWQAVLDEAGNVLDMVPITTSGRKHLRKAAKYGRAWQ